MTRRLDQRVMRALPTALATCLALAAIGCKVGHPIVDNVPQVAVHPDRGFTCAPAPQCGDTVTHLMPYAPERAHRIDLASCGGRNPIPCENDGDATPDDDAGTELVPPSCGAQAQEIAQSPKELSHSDFSCETLRIVLAEENVSEFVIDEAMWSHMNVTIESRRPVKLVIRGATLRDVFMSVGGPITLRMENAHVFDDVQIAGSTATGRPQVEIEVKEAKHLVVAEQDEPFAGSLSIKRTELSNSEIAVDDLTLHSVVMRGRHLSMDRLDATDSSFNDLVVSSLAASISASKLHNVDVQMCSQLSLFADQVTESNLAACDGEPLRVYGGSVSGVIIDGQIQSDDVTWSRTQFGTRSETKLEMWAGYITTSVFCPLSVHGAFGMRAQVKCSHCDGGMSGPAAVCNVPNMEGPRYDIECPAFEQAIDCTAPIPVRERPNH